jgi:asparagine N-glycosylation enzyme membrane subunit Stt3
MFYNLTGADSISEYVAARIPEISYLLSSILMIFASDYIIGNLLIRRLRKMGFVTRTCLFLLFGLLILPALTAIVAFLLRDLVIDPFKEWIILVLVICFFFIGVFLSIRYNMKIKLMKFTVR